MEWSAGSLALLAFYLGTIAVAAIGALYIQRNRCFADVLERNPTILLCFNLVLVSFSVWQTVGLLAEKVPCQIISLFCYFHLSLLSLLHFGRVLRYLLQVEIMAKLSAYYKECQGRPVEFVVDDRFGHSRVVSASAPLAFLSGECVRPASPEPGAPSSEPRPSAEQATFVGLISSPPPDASPGPFSGREKATLNSHMLGLLSHGPGLKHRQWLTQGTLTTGVVVAVLVSVGAAVLSLLPSIHLDRQDTVSSAILCGWAFLVALAGALCMARVAIGRASVGIVRDDPFGIKTELLAITAGFVLGSLASMCVYAGAAERGSGIEQHSAVHATMALNQVMAAFLLLLTCLHALGWSTFSIPVRNNTLPPPRAPIARFLPSPLPPIPSCGPLGSTSSFAA